MMQIQSAMPISTPPTSTPEQPSTHDTDFAAILSSHTETLAQATSTDEIKRPSDSTASTEDSPSDKSKSASESDLANAQSAAAAATPQPVQPSEPQSNTELTTSVLEAIDTSLNTQLVADVAEPAPTAIAQTAAETSTPSLEFADLLQATASEVPAPSAPVAPGDVAGTGQVDLSILEGVSITAEPAAASLADSALELPTEEPIVVTVAPELATSKPSSDAVTEDLAKVLHGPVQPTPPADASAHAGSSAKDEHSSSDAPPPATQAPVHADSAEGVRSTQHSEAFSVAASADVRPSAQTRAAVTENIRSEVWAIAQRAQNLARVEAVMHTALGDLSVVARHTATGVHVTLAGDAAANLDLSSLQGELAGMDVSVDLSQQPRALEWESDTVVTRAPAGATSIVPTTQARSAQSQLDVLA